MAPGTTSSQPGPPPSRWFDDFVSPFEFTPAAEYTTSSASCSPTPRNTYRMS